MWRNLVFSRCRGYRDSDYYVPEPHKNVDRNGSIYSQDSGQKKEKTAENRGILEICNEVPYFITFLKKNRGYEKHARHVNYYTRKELQIWKLHYINIIRQPIMQLFRC